MRVGIQKIFIVIGILAIFIISIVNSCHQSVESDPPNLLTSKDYAGSETCQSCHKQEYADWQKSDHQESMMEAGFQSVKGYFNTEFTSQGVTSRFFIRDGKYMVNTQGQDGNYHDYEVVYTFGIRPLQQYIVKFPDGRFQCLRIAWDTEKREWFDLYPNFVVEPDEWLHWSRGALNWNTMCSDCHSTNVHKNFDEETNSFNTTYSIINVSCESCHGPGRQHVEFVNSKRFDSAFYNAREHLHMIKGLTAYEQVDQCARCHAHRVQYTDAFNHEGEFMDHYVPSILREGLYFADGQIQDEVFEYGSFVQSKMYQNNVKCSDCHNPHSLELKAIGNALCAQCHSPSLYDTPKHHFHVVNTEGAECINCHMDGRYYMGNDYRRDHSFRVPRPDLSVIYGTPDACNSCHDDKTAEWASEYVEKWYGPDRAPHFSEVLADGRTGSSDAVPKLIDLADNTSQPAIARATAVYYLDQYVAPEAVEAIVRSLKSKDHIVRHTAIGSLIKLPPAEKAKHLSPLLRDEIRTVRLAAANALADVPREKISPGFRVDFERGIGEYQNSFAIRMDFPGGQFEKGQFFDRTGLDHQAEQAYLKAIELDNRLNAARINLAHLYNRQGHNQKAIELFEKVVEQEPYLSIAYYSLGLLHAEENNWKEAIVNLSKAAEMEENPRVFYNLGIAFHQFNQPEKAEEAYLKGLKLSPNNPDIMYAIGVLYVQENQSVKARPYLKQLMEMFPDNMEFKRLFDLVK